MRNIVLLCIILQGKVKTQSFCRICEFKKQRSHGSQLILLLVFTSVTALNEMPVNCKILLDIDLKNFLSIFSFSRLILFQ